VINGTPSSSNHLLANTVTVAITGGVLYASNATGAFGNTLDDGKEMLGTSQENGRHDSVAPRE
jgi:hypothetical protein